MSEAEGRKQLCNNLERYLVDSRLQFAFALPLLVIVLTIAVACLAGST